MYCFFALLCTCTKNLLKKKHHKEDDQKWKRRTYRQEIINQKRISRKTNLFFIYYLYKLKESIYRNI